MKKMLILFLTAITILFLQNCEVPSKIAESEVENKLPVITISSPTSTGDYQSGKEIELSSKVEDSDGVINKTEKFINNDSNEDNSVILLAGTHCYKIIAEDDLGGVTIDSVEFTVTNTAPLVQISSPTPAQNFLTGSQVNFTADVTDEYGTVSAVKLELDDVEVNATVDGSSYSYNWASATEGTHSFKLTATDNDGGVSVETVSFNVDNAENTPPTCEINPLSGGNIVNVGQTLNLSVTATDADGSITKVVFYVDGALRHTATTEPFNFDYLVEENVNTWKHNITAIAHDDQGAYTGAEVLELTINKVPVVSLIPLAEGWLITPGSTVQLKAQATDPTIDGEIAAVKFYIDGNLVPGEVEQSGDFYTINYNHTAGSIVVDQFLKLKVTAEDNNFGISEDKTYLIVSFIETLDDFALEFAPWIQHDLDGIKTFTIQDVTFPNQAYTGSYIVFNPSQTTPAMGANWTPHSGEKYLGCMSAMTTDTPLIDNNDWLISPPVSISEGDSLIFWAKSPLDTYGLERFTVSISDQSTEPSDFTTISTALNTAGKDYVEAPTEWHRYSFDLSAFSGDNKHFAITCVTHDAFMFLLDDIGIVKAGGKSIYNWNFEGNNSNNGITERKAVKKK